MDRLDLCRAACRAQLLASDGEPHTGALCHFRGIDLVPVGARAARGNRHLGLRGKEYGYERYFGAGRDAGALVDDHVGVRSEEHTSELQSLMRISYAVFCLKKKKKKKY